MHVCMCAYMYSYQEDAHVCVVYTCLYNSHLNSCRSAARTLKPCC